MALAREQGLGRIEVANAPMLATLASNAEMSLAEAERAIAMAAAAHQTRAELTGHHAAMSMCIVCARPELVAAQQQPIGFDGRRLDIKRESERPPIPVFWRRGPR
jgi:hypothetical protein